MKKVKKKVKETEKKRKKSGKWFWKCLILKVQMMITEFN